MRSMRSRSGGEIPPAVNSINTTQIMNKNLPLKVVLSRIGEPTPEEHRASSIALDNAEAIFDFWQSVIGSKPDFEPEKENLIAILLDAKLRPKG